MTRPSHLRTCLALAVLALAGAALGACKSDSPTAPTPPPNTGVPPAAPPSAAWVVTLTADPAVLEIAVPPDTQLSSLVTVDVRSNTGARPADNSTITLSAIGGTLSGAGFDGLTNVVLFLIGGRASVFFTPAAVGTGIVQASFQGVTGAVQIVTGEPAAAAPFVLSRATPSVVSPAGGDTVTITTATGSRPFANPVTVLIDGQNATVLSVSPTSIRVRMPAANPPVPTNSTRTVDVVVTNAAGTLDQASATLVAALTYSHGGSVVQPVIFSFTPTTGPVEGGTVITIVGSGFEPPVQVIFEFAGATTVQLEAVIHSVSASEVVFRSPDVRPYVAAGTLVSPISATIRVVNRNSGFFTTTPATQPFSYGATMRITSISPGEISFEGGQRVTIFGHGFEDPVAVDFGGFGQAVISTTGTQIVVSSQRRTGLSCDSRTSALVRVTNIEGGAVATFSSITIAGPLSPVVTGVVPAAGGVGASVVVSGRNFPPTGSARVTFGDSSGSGSNATITSQSSTTITVVVPQQPNGFTFDTEPCDGNGDGIPGGERNIPTPIGVTVTNLDTSCAGFLASAFTLTPSNTACTGDESQPPTLPACSNGADDDSDGFTDGADAGCTGPNDTDERTPCQDGIDNDGDTLIDFGPNPTNDPGCSSVQDTTET